MKPIYYIKDDPEKQERYVEKSKQLSDKQEKKKVVRQELTRNFILTKRKYRSKCTNVTLLEVRNNQPVLYSHIEPKTTRIGLKSVGATQYRRIPVGDLD